MRITIFPLMLLTACGGAPEAVSPAPSASSSTASPAAPPTTSARAEDSVRKLEPAPSAAGPVAKLDRQVELQLIMAAEDKVEALPEHLWLSKALSGMIPVSDVLPGCAEKRSECVVRVRLGKDAPYYIFDVPVDGPIMVLTELPDEDKPPSRITYAEFHQAESAREKSIDKDDLKNTTSIGALPEVKKHIASVALQGATFTMWMVSPPPFFGCDAKTIAAAEAAAKANPPVGYGYVPPAVRCMAEYYLGDAMNGHVGRWITVYANEKGPAFAESDFVDEKVAGSPQPWAVIRSYLK